MSESVRQRSEINGVILFFLFLNTNARGRKIACDGEIRLKYLGSNLKRLYERMNTDFRRCRLGIIVEK
jgi:hypothetical protein